VPDPLKTFISNLRARRDALGLTQEAVAWSAHMDPSHYRKVESGRVDPSIRTVSRLAAALATTPSDLLRGVEGTARHLGQ
jgi:transcriptional regulator with XRE-family HTH domain